MSRMPRYAQNADRNQPEIVKAMEARGASVHYLKVPVDLLVGHAGKTALVEIKNPKTPYGRRGANENQKNFMSTWNGGAVALVDGVEAAMSLLTMMEKA